MNFTQSGIYRGDAFSLLPQLPDKCVDHIITDPPYDFSQQHIHWLQEQFVRIAKQWVVVFSPPENPWVLNADQYLFWVKPISTKNTSHKYSRFVEQIFVYKISENATWNTDYHWSQYSNVFTDLVEGWSSHPYEKPESLIKRLVRNHTRVSETIFDPFCGSGRIPVVAKKLERTGIGVELTEQWSNFGHREMELINV